MSSSIMPAARETHSEPSEWISLEGWARAKYGEDAPSIYTLRRWCQQGKIQPPAQKHGRTIYVKREARYVNYNDPNFDGALQ